MFGNRGIYHKGWTAVTKHRTPWETGAEVKPPAFDDDVWELYDTTTDWTQAHDLAAEHPEKLHELRRLWLIEAVKYQVVPLDDRFVERGLPETAGRPTLIQGKRQPLFSGMGRLTENSVVTFKNTSFSLTAQLTVPEEGADGVIVAQGGVTGGLSLYAKVGKPRYCYNFFGLERYYVKGTKAIPPGDHQVRMEFAYDGGGLGKGGTATIYIDGEAAGEGHIEQTEAFLFSADETMDVGNEFGSPVTTDYSTRKFNGKVHWVEIDVGLDDHNHLIRPEDRLHLAMAIQ
jgi:arylsulfatase